MDVERICVYILLGATLCLHLAALSSWCMGVLGARVS